MHALVTGANGFIGSFLVEELIERGYRVRCLILPGESPLWPSELPVEIVRGDVRQKEVLERIVEGTDYVYHLAGVKTVWAVETYFRVNFEGTKNLFDMTLQKNPGLRRFVYVSSQAAAGPSTDGHGVTEDESPQPVTSYGKSKRAAEEYLKAHTDEMAITILRPALVYGPRNRETELIFELGKRGVFPVIRNHDQFLNLIYVQDVVRGLIRAGEHERGSGQVYFLTTPEPYTWSDIAACSFQVLNKKGRVVHVPRTCIRLTAGAIKSVRRLFGQPFELIDEKMEEMFQSHWVCSGEKAKRELGFEPRTPLLRGIEETARWYEDSRR